jgi:RNA polymerase sigma-B factor
MHVMDHSPVSGPTLGTLSRCDHERADELLVALASCPEDRRHDLENEVVILTMDIAENAARRYCGRGLEFDDLRQVALLALVKAVRGYRVGRGPCFAAYAVPTVSGELKRHFRDVGWSVRPPRRLQEARSRLAAGQEELRSTLRREPTQEELAASLQMCRDELREAMQATCCYHAVSLDGNAANGTTTDVVDQHNVYGIVDQHDALTRALQALSDRELEILRLRFVEERTQSDIGDLIGVSQMQVSRLLSSAVGKLRSTMLAAEAAA